MLLFFCFFVSDLLLFFLQDFTKFKPLDRKLVERVDKMLSEDVPRLMSMIPQEEQAYVNLHFHLANEKESPGNTIFHNQRETPFAIGGAEGINVGVGEYDWIVERSRNEYDQIFAQLSPQNGKISGASAKQEMIKSKLVILIHMNTLAFCICKFFV